MLKKMITTIFLAMLAVSAFTGCQPATVATSAPQTGDVGLTTASNPYYRIIPGDELELKFLYHPELNERLDVRPDGAISVLLLQDIMVAGKMPEEVATELRAGYASELKDPEVTVIVRRATGAMAYVGGEVKTPQMVPLNSPTTLFQAIIRSGEVLASAEQDNVLVLRAGPNRKPVAIKVNLRRIRTGKQQDILLEPYDIVYVPRTVISEVGLFVDQYINNIIPRNVTVSFPFIYELHSETNIPTVTTP